MNAPGRDRPWFFDAHCDTFLKVVEHGAEFAARDAAAKAAAAKVTATAAGLHVTLPGLKQAGVRAQVFAAWTLAERLQGREDEVALQVIAAVKAACAAHPEVVLVRTAADLAAVTADPGRIAAICALESADPLKGDPLALDRFFAAGVRLVTLVWGDNAFCGATFGKGGGLTEAGRQLVARCEQLGVMVDVSHASDAGFRDLCGVATRPFVASHSNCRALCDHARNLDDDMIRALADRGGVAGINLCPGFLSPDIAARCAAEEARIRGEPGADRLTIDDWGSRLSAFNATLPRPPLSLVADHVKHFIQVGGEDCVGLGGDLDGIDALPAGVDAVADYPRIAELLAGEGLTSSQVAKVCHGNLLRVFGEVLPGGA